ncbi:hypothetical protein G4B88_020768 [Cannabis sativa]|uniref:Disease resistance protein n=1 Tax=Cannabis sativa TaxID=3483 RepID=A0A7J6HMB6_CANSA|nr:hypothetical protein G4B88_020768 [Cannabis sativa]
MEKLLERFETFEKQKDILNLQEGVEKIMTHRPPSMSTIDDSEFFGRDDEKKISRSFFQRSNVHAFRFIMHDLMVDLANFVSRKKFIQMERNKFYEIEMMKQTRHVTVPLESCDIDELFKSISKGTCMQLNIYDCPELGSSLPMMPNVTKIRISCCKKLPGFKSSNSDHRYVPANLRDLNVGHCGNLEFLPPYRYEFLQYLSIENSSNSFELLNIDSFPNIKYVQILNCENVESFSQFNSPINSLSFLSFYNCPNFTLLPDNNFLCPILTQLKLLNCCKLRFLPEKLPILLPSLQQLVIDDCPELESLPKLGLPLSLCELRIERCDKVIASRKNWNLETLPNLISLEFGGYRGEDMVSFLEQGFLPTSLISLKINDIACLKTLNDNGGFQELTSLKELHVSNCPNLQTLPVKGLPPSFEGSLPPSFESFKIYNCPLLEENYEWEEENSYSSSKKISCITQPQVTIRSQHQELITPHKQSFSWFGPKALFHSSMSEVSLQSILHVDTPISGRFLNRLMPEAENLKAQIKTYTVAHPASEIQANRVQLQLRDLKERQNYESLKKIKKKTVQT